MTRPGSQSHTPLSWPLLAAFGLGSDAGGLKDATRAERDTMLGPRSAACVVPARHHATDVAIAEQGPSGAVGPEM